METKANEKQWIWTDDYLIASYEVDARGKAPLPNLCKFMQETAYNHAFHLEFGYEHLKAQNRFWVLARLLIKIDRYPDWGEKIKLRTWPTGVDGLFACRDFRFVDNRGITLGGAASSWLILDAERRRPQRPGELKERIRFYPGERAVEGQPSRLPKLSHPGQGPFFPVQYSDLDLYNHVNNARYIQWVLDSYAPEMHRDYEVETFEINFLAEAKMGDEAAIQTEKAAGSAHAFLHSIKRKADDRDICLVRVEWRKQQAIGIRH
jgi:medium-chain acyl-[acyl-carrier-protein] hydrolase